MKNVRHRYSLRTVFGSIIRTTLANCTTHPNRTGHTTRHNYATLRSAPSGFTLVEILVVIFLVTILATVAISSYVNSTDTFNFLAEYKNVMSSLRTARSYAITNKETGGEVPERYGVLIRDNRVIAFADTGDDEFVFEDPTPVLIAPILGGGPLPIIVPGGGSPADNDSVIKRYNFSDYEIEVLDSTAAHNPIELPVLIFYNNGNGEITIFSGSGDDRVIIDKNEQKYIAIRFHEIVESANSSEKFILMFQVSGLPEEFNNLDDL